MALLFDFSSSTCFISWIFIEHSSRTLIIARCELLSPLERSDLTKKIFVIALIVILASYVHLGILPKGLAVDPVTFYIDPAKTENVALTPGAKFFLLVKLDNIPAVPGLAGIQFTIVWNSDILKGVSLQEIVFHNVTPEDQWSNIWQINNKVANDSVTYAFTFQDVAAAVDVGYAPISGSHTVANITLQVVGTGKSTLGFTVHKLGDPEANSIDHIVENATFSNVGAPPSPKPALLSVDPAKISNGSLGLGATFAVNVKIVNASDVAGLEFKLGFNASALNVETVIKGAFIPVSDTAFVQIDNSTGFAEFNVSLSAPLNGDGVVAIVEFQVMAEGVKNSTLHLYDVNLVDSGAASLPFSTADGSFSNLKTILGDLNHDGIVDIKDAILFSQSFGSVSGDQRFNPEADMDGDDQIDIFDLILISIRFGSTF